MRLIISEFMSLDGVIQAPGGADEDRDGGFAHGGWSMPFFDPETMGATYAEVLASTDALLFGRRTWQTMAAAWPGRAGDPFADRMNGMEKYVVTSSLGQADLTWANSTRLDADGDLASVRRLLDAREGNLLVMGSASLVHALIRGDLVDAYRLMLEPVTLGGGKRLFPDDGNLRALRLVSATTAATGVQICHYEPVREA